MMINVPKLMTKGEAAIKLSSVSMGIEDLAAGCAGVPRMKERINAMRDLVLLIALDLKLPIEAVKDPPDDTLLQMTRPSDVRSRPGDPIMVRGCHPIRTYQKAGDFSTGTAVVMPGTLGIVLAIDEKGWTYVLWSCPVVTSWIYDGYLRKVKVKTNEN